MVTKDMLTSFEMIIKLKLTIESIPKAFQKLINDSKVMFCALNGASNVGFSKEKHAFIIITRVFLHSARSAQVCSIALNALERTRFFKVLAVRHLTMALGFQLTWACTRSPLLGLSAVRLIVSFRLERTCAQSQHMWARSHC